MAEDYDLIAVPHAASQVFGIQLANGAILTTHGPTQCANEHCSIHNPSDHPLNTAPMNWRADRALMERLCEHGIGHPDPDDIAYKRTTRGDRFADAEAIHGCDGCCKREENDNE